MTPAAARQILSWCDMNFKKPRAATVVLKPLLESHGRFYLHLHGIALIAIALVLGSVTPALGAVVNIRAEFSADPSRPGNNTFENKTPNSSQFCVQYPSSCLSRGIVSISAPISFKNSSTIIANHADPRQGMMVRVNSEWRSLTVTDSQTLSTEQVKIRITAFGTVTDIRPNNIHELVPEATSWTDGHRRLWSGGFLSSGASPCISLQVPYLDGTVFGFFWTTPVPGATCSKQALYNIPSLRFRTTDFAYEMQTPNPLQISTGEYTGELTYTLGPNQDLDMGDNLLPDDSTLTLRFSLGVLHVLQIVIPPGGNKIELTPKGGWQQWLQKGRVPEKIYRDQTVLISASSRFKMQLSCDRVIGDTCAISNSSHEVPVDVRVSMPNGIANDGDSSAVSRKPLSVTTAQVFKSTFYVDNRASTLHFEIQKRHVEEMLSEQGNYKGNITAIWDSDI